MQAASIYCKGYNVSDLKLWLETCQVVCSEGLAGSKLKSIGTVARHSIVTGGGGGSGGGGSGDATR